MPAVFSCVNVSWFHVLLLFPLVPEEDFDCGTTWRSFHAFIEGYGKLWKKMHCNDPKISEEFYGRMSVL